MDLTDKYLTMCLRAETYIEPDLVDVPEFGRYSQGQLQSLFYGDDVRLPYNPVEINVYWITASECPLGTCIICKKNKITAGSWEEFWLKIVMKKLYNKKWSGGKNNWIEV